MEHKQKGVLIGGLGLIILLGILLMVVKCFDRKVTNTVSRDVDSINYFPSESSGAVTPPTLQALIFEPFEKWDTYKSKEIGIEITYPHELFLDTKEANKVIFDSLAPNDPAQKIEGSILMKFKVSFENESTDILIAKRASDKLMNFKQETISLNNISAKKISYTDVFSGGTFYETYIPQGSGTVVIWYAGNQQVETIFSKMLSTVKYSK